MRTLVLIPCYNEEENILGVVAELKDKAPWADCLVINDCSTDSSEQLLQENGIPHLSLPINLGIGGGMQCGYRYAVRAGYDITVQMDGDGQHDPAWLHAVVDPVAGGRCDMCIGSRFLKKEGFQTTFMRRLGIQIESTCIRLLCGVTVKDATSGYRACSSAMTRYFSENYAQDYPEPEAILAASLAGFRVQEAPVVMRERQGGKSSIAGFKAAYYMIKVTLSLVIHRIGLGRPKGGKA